MDAKIEEVEKWIHDITEGELSRTHPLQSHLWRSRTRLFDGEDVYRGFCEEGCRLIEAEMLKEAALPPPRRRMMTSSSNSHSSTSGSSTIDSTTTESPVDADAGFSVEEIGNLADYVLRRVTEHGLKANKSGSNKSDKHTDGNEDDALLDDGYGLSPEMVRALMPPSVDEMAEMLASAVLVAEQAEEDAKKRFAMEKGVNISHVVTGSDISNSSQLKRMRTDSTTISPTASSASAVAMSNGHAASMDSAAMGSSRAGALNQRLPGAGAKLPPPPPASAAATAAQDSDRDPNALKNRFKSAKQQHVEEGGVLKRKESNGSSTGGAKGSNGNGGTNASEASDIPEELQQYDKAIVQKIMSDIVSRGQAITFDDISGLDFAKKCVQELICWPMLRPDIFTGLRALPKGLLLFGPPGTGKTLIGKAIAHETGATFFSISASSLTSKWIGEGEAGVRALFAVAAYYQPSVVFIDEVDSLLSQRSSEENEASRRIKTEFLIQLDGAGNSRDARVVIIGATNRPQELDEAARRRFVKRIYIPLPDKDSRVKIIENLLRSNKHHLDAGDVDYVAESTAGFSGADMSALCTEAAMCPLRELASRHMGDLRNLRESDVPHISRDHFEEALQSVSCSVSQRDLQQYVDWNIQYGTYKRME